MNTLKIRDLVVGEGAPKIIVPIVGKTMQQILDKADELKYYTYDVVEWRVDFYEHALDTGKVLEVAGALRAALGETPILFTFRTAHEGGEQSISPENYTALNKAVAESGYVDLIDVEIFAGEELVRENIANIHAAGVAVVGSNHEFEKTPDKADLLYRLRKMQDHPAGCHTGNVYKICRSPHYHHEHGSGRCDQPPERRGFWLGHDLRRGGAGERTRADPGGAAAKRFADPAHLVLKNQIKSNGTAEISAVPFLADAHSAAPGVFMVC